MEAIKQKKAQAVRNVITQKCEELGPITYHEASVLVAFLTCMLLWFFRSPGKETGFLMLLETDFSCDTY